MGNCCSCKNVLDDLSLWPRPPSRLDYTDAAAVEKDGPLLVEKLDFCLEENTRGHHTDGFEITKRQNSPTLVIRRGQEFTLNVIFNRPYNEAEDGICVAFTLKDAKVPSYSQKTLIVVPVLINRTTSFSDWSTSTILNASDDKSLAIVINPSPKAIIGEWHVDIDTKLNKKSDGEDFGPTYRYTSKYPIIILFNPWCKADDVYMESYAQRKECVTEDFGLVWRGTHSNIRKTAWNYGQYEKDVLECSLYVLKNVGRLLATSRGNPVKVARHISAVVNVQDEGGVIVGNWTGKYNGGSSPTKWGGSVKILQQYFKTKKPVKFGQCWVFAGVVTTICRAIGIPSRVVTNFSSAHDTNCSLTVDYFFDEEGDGIDKLNNDSVWNFHVWNELWMQRPDLEPGDYGGWQAIDATPQESSDGIFRCGPASLKAIKRGEVTKNYDVSFLFAEVNADKVYWRYNGKDKPLKLIANRDQEIGKSLSTKAVDSTNREDITHSYKHYERTNDEREVMLSALRQSANLYSRYYLNDNFEDIEFDFKLEDDIMIGSSFKVTLNMKNKNVDGKGFNVKVILRAASMQYNGQLKDVVKKETFLYEIKSRSYEKCEMVVNFKDYEKHLTDQGSFHISAVCKVLETGFDYFAQDDFRVKKPDIRIKLPNKATVNRPFPIVVSFTNPLPKPLTKGKFTIEGPGLTDPVTIRVKKTTKQGEECKTSHEFTPKTPGDKNIIVKFEAKELEDVDGHATIKIVP